MQRLEDALGELDGVGQAASDHDDGEFVASKPGSRVAGAQGALQALGGLLQERIADIVPVGIVHGLEAVEVDEEQSDRASIGPRPVEGGLEARLEQRPVGEAGEDVVIGRPPHLLFGNLTVGDVEGYSDEALSLARPSELRAAGGKPDLAPIRAGEAVFGALGG